MRSLLLRTLRVLTRALIVGHSSSGGTLLLRPEKIPSQEENTKVLKNLNAVDFGICAVGNGDAEGVGARGRERSGNSLADAVTVAVCRRERDRAGTGYE